MKKYISVFIIAALLMSMFSGLGGTALAAGAGITLSTTSATVNAGDTVNITASITNNSGEAFTDYHIKVNGTSTTFGGGAALAAGDTNPNVPISFAVGQDMLNTDVTFVAEYQLASAPGTWQTGDSATFHIAKKELAVKVAASASSSVGLAEPGDTITLTVNVQNQGEATLENVEVKAPNVSGAWGPSKFSLAPGQSQNVTCQYKFTAKITITPAVTYTVAGSAAPQTCNVENPIMLDLAVRNVKPSLTISNQSPQPGEEVTLTLTISNEGTMPYTDLKVTRGGEAMDFPATKLNAGDAPSQEYKMTFDKSETVEFVITLKDQNKATRTVKASIDVQLPVDQNALSQNVLLSLEADRLELTSAGTVNFSGRVSNNSDFKISEVKVTEPTLGEVFSVSEMEPGTYQDIEKTADINETTTYNFTLTFKDKNGQTYTVNNDPLTITIQSLEPSPTDPSDGAAQVTLEPTEAKSDPLLIWFIIAGVLLVLIIGVGVAIVVLWKKGKSPSRVSAARSAAPRPSGPKMSSKPRTPFNGGGRGRPVKKGKGGFRDRNNF